MLKKFIWGIFKTKCTHNFLYPLETAAIFLQNYFIDFNPKYHENKSTCWKTRKVLDKNFFFKKFFELFLAHQSSPAFL